MAKIKNYFYLNEKLINSYYEQLTKQFILSIERRIPIIGLTFERKKSHSPSLIEKAQQIEQFILKKEQPGNFLTLQGQFIHGTFRGKYWRGADLADMIIITSSNMQKDISTTKMSFIILGYRKHCLFVEQVRNFFDPELEYLVSNRQLLLGLEAFINSLVTNNSNYSQSHWMPLLETLLFMDENSSILKYDNFEGLCLVRKRFKNEATDRQIVFLYPLLLSIISDSN